VHYRQECRYLKKARKMRERGWRKKRSGGKDNAVVTQLVA